MEGYYRKPKVDWELLDDHSEGVIATTGCLGGHVLQAMVPRRSWTRQAAATAVQDERFDAEAGAGSRTSSGATTSSSSSRTTASPSSTAPTRS